MIKKFLLLMILSLFINCSNEIDPDFIPSFDGISADENTIFVTVIEDNQGDRKLISKIHAIDTKNDKKLYTYEFKRKVINLIHDSSFDINPYIWFYDGRIYKLDVKSGILNRLDINFYTENYFIFDNKLWASPHGDGDVDKPVEYFTYNASNNKSEYVTLPEGKFFGDFIKCNSNSYLYLSYYSYEKEIPDKFYNYSTGKTVDIILTAKNYEYYSLVGNNYLFCDYYSDDFNWDYDVFGIKSIEPKAEYQFLFTMENEYLFFNNLFENENYIFLVSAEVIVIRDKTNDYEKINTIVLDKDEYSNSSSGYYCRDGYIWIVSKHNDGVYKFNMNSFTYEVIK